MSKKRTAQNNLVEWRFAYYQLTPKERAEAFTKIKLMRASFFVKSVWGVVAVLQSLFAPRRVWRDYTNRRVSLALALVIG